MDSKQGIQDLPLKQQQRIASCREQVLQAPDDPQAHGQLAEAYLMADKVDLALGELEIAEKLQPHSASIHYQLGKVHSHLGQDNLAETAYRRALACDAKFYQASLALADLLARRRMVNEAIHILEESLRHSPDSEGLYWALGWLYMPEDKEHAIQVIEQGLRILPEAYLLHVMAGILYREAEEFGRSLAALRTAARLDPTNAEAYAETACTLLALQRLDEAEKEARRALQIEPEHAEALHHLGWILHQQKRLSEATQVLEEAIVLEPGNPEAYRELAHVFRDMGEPARALAILQSGLAVTGEEASLYNEMANIYGDLGEPDAALEASARAVELAPEELYYRTMHGARLSDEGRDEEAIREWAQVLAVKPDYKLAVILLVGTQAELGLRAYIDDNDVIQIIHGEDGELEEQRQISERVQKEVEKQLELHKHEVAMQKLPAYIEAARLPSGTGYFDQWLEDTAATNRKSKEIAEQLRVIAARNNTIARYIYDSCRRYWFAQEQGSPGHDLMLDLEKAPRTLVEFGERVRLLRRYIDCFHAPGYRWKGDNLEYMQRYFDSIGFTIPARAFGTLDAIRGVSNDFGRHVTKLHRLTSHLQNLGLSYPLEEDPATIHRAYLKILQKLAAAMQDILDVVSEAAKVGALA